MSIGPPNATVLSAVNKSIGQSGPEVYLRKIAPAVLESQCIPTDESLWRIDAANKFWEARRELLAEAFNEYLKQALPDRRL